MADAQPTKPTARLEDGLVHAPQGLPRDPCFLCGLTLAGGVLTAASSLGEVQVRPEYPQSALAPSADPRGGLYAVAQCGEVFMGVLSGFHCHGAVDRRARIAPDATDVVVRSGLPGAQRDGLGESATLVVGVHQQTHQLIDCAAETSDIAGDGRGDPVTVIGRALPVLAPNDGPAVGAELAVAARRVAAGQISEQDEVGRIRGELIKPQGRELSGCDCLWLGF